MTKSKVVKDINTNSLSTKDIADKVVMLFSQLQNLEVITQCVNEIKSDVLAYMEENGVDELNLKGIGKVNLVEKAESFIVDSKKLQAERYDIYQQFVKVKNGCKYITTKKY